MVHHGWKKGGTLFGTGFKRTNPGPEPSWDGVRCSIH